MNERKEEMAGYGFQMLVSTDMTISLLPEEERAKKLEVLERVGRKRYAYLMGLVIVLLKEKGMIEEKALKEAAK